MEEKVSWIKRPRSMESLLHPNYECDNGRFELGLPHIRPAWLKDESIKSLDCKFPMVPAPEGTIVLYTTPLGEKLWKNSAKKEFDLTDPLRPSLSYNYLHDEHLKYYFRSDDIRKRLKDEGFITQHGFVKCTLKEFNEYRQWIRNLKLRELYRERKLDKKLAEEARKQRLDCLALERDVELQEIMKRRRERRQKDNEIRKKMIEKEKKRQQKLSQIDNKRREQFMKIKANNKERILRRRDVERMKRRKNKDKQERKEYKIKLRITTKMDFQSDDRLRKLQEKKDEIMKEKSKMIKDQWFRRKSWSHEYHEEQRRSRELQEQEFHDHVMERNVKVSRQRRHSQVCYEEIANANRIAFETQLQDAEVFMAKLNEKRTRELDEWKKQFNEIKQSTATSSVTSMKSPSLIEKRKKRGQRRRSTWDLESCLLRDLGMNEAEISENAYSKLGVISRGVPVVQEPEFLGKKEKLGVLEEIKEHLEGDNKDNLEDRHFALPMIVESLASIHTRSPSAQSESSELSRTGEEIEDEPITQLPFKAFQPRGSIHNIGMSQDELCQVISKYVENILYRSSEVLGMKIKLPERIKQTERSFQVEAFGGSEMVAETKDNEKLRRQVVEYVKNIVRRSSEIVGVKIKLPDRSQQEVRNESPVKSTKAFKTTKHETAKSVTSTRIKVKELLSNILDNAEKSAGVIIKRPPEYELIKKQLQKQETYGAEERPVEKLVDSKQKYTNVRTVAKQLVVDIMKSVAKQMNIIIKLPTEYQTFCKPNENRMVVCTTDIMNPISIGNKILEVEDELDKERAKRLRHENLIMMASQVTLEALSQALLLVRIQKRNNDFFMEGEQEIVVSSPQRSRELTARMKIERCEELRKKCDNVQEEEVPREIDFLNKFKKLCGSDLPEITSFITKYKSNSPTELGKKHENEVGESNNNKTGRTSRVTESEPGKDAKKPEDQFDDNGKALNVKTQGTVPSSGTTEARKSAKKSRDAVKAGESKEEKSSRGREKELQNKAGGNNAGKDIPLSKNKEEELNKVNKTFGKSVPTGKGTEDKTGRLASKEPGDKKSRHAITKPEGRLKSAAKTKETGEKVSRTSTKKSGETSTKKPGNKIMSSGPNEPGDKIKNVNKVAEDIATKKPEDEVMTVDKTNQPENKTNDIRQEVTPKETNDDTKVCSKNALTNITKEPKDKLSSIDTDDSDLIKKAGHQVTNAPVEKAVTKEQSDTAKESGDKITNDVTEKPTDKKVGAKSESKVHKTGTKKITGVKKTTKPWSNATKKTEGKIEIGESEGTGNETPNAVKPEAVDRVEPGESVQVSEKLETKLPAQGQTKEETKTGGVGDDVKEISVNDGAQSIVEPEKEDNKKKRNVNVKEKIIKHDDQEVDKEFSEKKESKEQFRASTTGSSLESPGNKENVDILGSSRLDIRSPSFPQISPTSESFTFGLQSITRSGAITPSRETSPNQERLAVGSKSSVILRMISMREEQEQCDLSPHSSYVVLPQLSSSESAFISGIMQSTLKGNGQNTKGVKSPTPINSTQGRFSVTSPVPSREVIPNSTSDEQMESVKLPRVSSPDICQLTPRSPTPTRCTSRSSIVSLPHIGVSNTSLVGSNEITSTSINKKSEKKVDETTGTTSKTTISQPDKLSDPNLQKSENQSKKSEDIAEKKHSGIGQAKKDQVLGAKRRDSKSRSSTTVVSTRRPSVKSYQEMSVQRTDSIYARAKRASISKSMGVAIVPARKMSYGEDTHSTKPLTNSKTDIRRGSVGSEKKSKTSSTHLLGKGKGRRYSKMSISKMQHLDNIDGKKTDGPTEKQSKDGVSQSKDSARSEENEKVSSGMNKTEKPLTNTENKFLSSVQSGERVLTSVDEDAPNLSKAETSPSGCEVKTNASITKVIDGLSKKVSTHDSNNHENIQGGKNEVDNTSPTKTKSQTDSKIKEPNKKKSGEQLVKAKISSKTLALKQSSEKTKNMPKKGSEKSEHAIKRSSNSRVGIQESKHGTRKMSVIDSTKVSEKNIRKRSSTVSEIVKSKTSKTKATGSTHSRKDGKFGKSAEKFEKDQATKSSSKTTSSAHAQKSVIIGTSGALDSEDAILSDVPGKADSDTEVVMQVYIADSPNQPEGSDEVSAEKSEKKQEEASGKAGNKTTDGDKKKTKGPVKKKKKDGLLVVGSGTVKSSPTREDLLKKSSSRKPFGGNLQERNLVNILPRNSLDILKVTKISKTELGKDISGNQTIQPPQTKTTPSRTTVGQKTPGSRNYRKHGVADQGNKTTKLGILGEGVVGLTSTSLGLKGEGLTVKSSKSLRSHPSMQRVSSKISSNLERVEETPSLESPTEGQTKEPYSPSRSQGPSDETLTDALAVNKVGVVTKHLTTENKISDSHKEVIKKESSENVSKSSIPKNVSINSSSFSDIVQGTPLLSKDSGKSTASKTSSPRSSVASHGHLVPTPPITSKPGVVSPKISRVKRTVSNGSSGRSRGSLGSNEMSPTASLEIVKLSSQGSHGWVSSPTSSVKFLPPIEARASKSSNNSDDSQKQRPRTAESGTSRTGSGNSRGATIVEIRRSSSGTLRVDGKPSGLIAVKSSSSGGSAKQTVIGF